MYADYDMMARFSDKTGLGNTCNWLFILFLFFVSGWVCGLLARAAM